MKKPTKKGQKELNRKRRTRRAFQKLGKLRPAPFARGSSTSQAAADSIEERRLGMMLEIRNFIEKKKKVGATCDEVEHALSYLHQTASARIYDLKAKKFIVPSHLVRRTRSGCLARVYVIPKYGPRMSSLLEGADGSSS